ncbi:FAD-dependent urate hydroxylase [Rhizina undulata]
MFRYIGGTVLVAASIATAFGNKSFVADQDLLKAQYEWSLGARPAECPPCFNCLLPAFHCTQYAECSSNDGKCECPPGFGGDDCLQPLCGSLAAGNHRPAQEKGKQCECDEGWGGINCNVCQSDDACNKLMPQGIDGVCYKQGIAIKENYQMCDVTNRKILEMLKRKPQVTFTCNELKDECQFQFWVDYQESFYCTLDDCNWELKPSHDKNVTDYECKNARCECIAGRTLCGENGTIDLSEFLTDAIKGPASFSCDSSKSNDQCLFSETAMNEVIKSIFGDETILLNCDAGECLHKSEVPGYERPVKPINKPLIAGVIAASALFVVAVILILWYSGRRANLRSGLGPIHLPDDDDEANRLMAEHRPATLHFENLFYSLNGKPILKGVTGAVNPGEVMAIMGPSGAGKTTFLDILAKKNKRGTVEGNIYVNGSTISDDEYRQVIGFVDQEDTMMPTLTVYETVLNSALLRLPRDMKFQEKNRRVIDVLRQLGIEGIKDNMIGSSEDNGIRGISGGEKRRVGIACELVTSPSILFLDEPTSGLDSFNAYNVVECLVNLARNYKRTVVFTIHQPKSNIVALFDRLVLLARGSCVYSGPFDKCQSYFDQQGYPCPPGFNIADYLVDLTMHAEQRRSRPQSEDGFTEEPRVSRAPTTNTSAPSSSISPDANGNGNDVPKQKGRKRGDSIRDRQARQLFTRKRSDVAADDITLEEDLENTWRNSSDQQRNIEETDHLLPPPANGNDATDLDVLIAAYRTSDVATIIKEEIRAAKTSNGIPDGVANGSVRLGTGVGMKGYKRVGWLGQFAILSRRTWTNLYRNPMLMLTHYAIAIVLAVLCGYLFFGIRDDISGFQNRMGLFFFVLALFGFSTLTSLNVFASERTLFLRERANGYYAPITYFAAKVVFDIVPLRIIPPVIMGTILYPMVGLVTEWPEFFKFLLVLVLFNLAAAAICLFIGIVLKDSSLANLVGSLVMLFSLLFAGLLLNHDSIPKPALWLQAASVFHYGFEALLVNEVKDLMLIEHKFGLDIEVPGATILSTFGFDNLAYWKDVCGLGVFAGVFVVAAYAAMHVLLVEKR